MTEAEIEKWIPLAEECLTAVLKRYQYDESRRENGKWSLKNKIGKALKNDLSHPKAEHLLPYFNDPNSEKADRLSKRRNVYSRIGN